MLLSRREFLLDSAATGLFAPGIAQRSSQSGYPFQHGVASGDPLTDRVIIWTRITPPTSNNPVTCRWLMATDVHLNNVVAEGYTTTTGQRDFTVKVDVEGLQPGSSYYYVFEALNQASDIGRTRTLPEGHVDHLRIAYTSCSNFAKGQFNVYRELAKRTDLDAVLHLGDYIYEYEDREDCIRTGRINEPLCEIQTLSDYRQRHACYKRDRDLQAVHQQHPFLVIWDDHEIANNAWKNQEGSGADNHDSETQGDWKQRLSSGVQAYLEWMPIREQPDFNRGIYRNFRFGDLVDLSLLDTRLAGRDGPAETEQERFNESRSLLGSEQEQWFETCLTAAQQEGVTWKLTGQQVMVSQFGARELPLNLDQWDGYPAARNRLFDAVERANADNWIVLTGDIHSSWALELHRDPFEGELDKPLGLEFVTPAVTSPGIENEAKGLLAATALDAVMPHLRFVDFFYRGYVLLDITPKRLQAEWWIVDSIETHRYTSACLKAFQVPAGSNQMAPAMAESKAKNAPASAPVFDDSLAFMRPFMPSSSQQPHGSGESSLEEMIAGISAQR
ncbi:MAG: alkaline phosphatase D family protein [Oceanobacter sp.]